MINNCKKISIQNMLCGRICPVLNTKNNESLNKCYVAYNKDANSKLNKASSGSIFELLANNILSQNGIVIGVAFDEKLKLNHIAIEDKEALVKLKGSKYLQSDLGEIFKYIRNNIDKRKILFVGTPCQVAGLKAYLGENENLICVDLICHGVPSPKLFQKYINEIENKYSKKIIDYNFRDKNSGWETYSNTITFDDNTKISQLQKDNNYMKLFLFDIALRESCYECNFKLSNKYSDITLGDFWGVKNKHPEMFNESGVSAMIVNTQKGYEIFDCIKDEIVYKECNLNEILDGNPSLGISVLKNKNRKKFFIDMKKLSTEQLVKKYVKKKSILIRFKNKITKIIKK